MIARDIGNQPTMKKLFLTLSLTLACTVFVKAQSKLSYSVLVNESYSTDNYHQICLSQSYIPGQSGQGLPCVLMDKAWKTNITLNANYEVSPRLRLQAGFGYNAMHLDEVNDVLGTSRYQVEYLSIPVRAHYFIKRSKVGFYIGTGLRTDIRLDNATPYDGEDIVADNSRNIAMSFETLLGIEVPLSSNIKVNFEPTYAMALTRYSRDLGFPLASPSAPTGLPYELIEEHPGRMGVSIGLTFSFDKK